jgi:hypothetical protein
MRRLIFAFVALSLAIPATAQMRSGVRAGSRFRMSAGRGPIIRTVPTFNGLPRGVNRFGFRHRGFNRFNNCFGFGFNSFGFRNGFCGGFGFNSGFGFGNGFGFGGYGLPYYLGDYETSTGAYNAEHVLRYHEDDRDRQLQDLTAEIRDQQRELDYLVNTLQQRPQGPPQYQGPQQAPQQGPGPRGSMLRQQMHPSAAARPEHEQPATTIIFKDGRRVDVRNYVIAKNTLTILDGGMRQRFQLSQVDLPATQKANDERGVDFKAPTATVSLLCNPADLDISCKQHSSTQETIRR